MESAWINANEPMEDRHSIHYLDEHGLMVAVFDGHSGHATSDVLSHYLATYVKRELGRLSPADQRDTVKVAAALSASFEKFDDDLTDKVVAAAIQVGRMKGGALGVRLTHAPTIAPISS